MISHFAVKESMAPAMRGLNAKQSYEQNLGEIILKNTCLHFALSLTSLQCTKMSRTIKCLPIGRRSIHWNYSIVPYLSIGFLLLHSWSLVLVVEISYLTFPLLVVCR